MSITSIQRWGNSAAVRLPKRILREAGMSESDQIELRADERGILIRKARQYESLVQLFAGYKGGYQPEEWQTGGAAGAEVFD